MKQRALVSVTEVVAANTVFNVLGRDILRKRRKDSFENINSKAANMKLGMRMSVCRVIDNWPSGFDPNRWLSLIHI